MSFYKVKIYEDYFSIKLSMNTILTGWLNKLEM